MTGTHPAQPPPLRLGAYTYSGQPRCQHELLFRGKPTGLQCTVRATRGTYCGHHAPKHAA